MIICSELRLVVIYRIARNIGAQELNLAVGSQITIANVLVDLNLAVRYGIAIRIMQVRNFWRFLICQFLKQTAKTTKLNSPPNFPAIQYYMYTSVRHWLGGFYVIQKTKGLYVESRVKRGFYRALKASKSHRNRLNCV